MKTITLLKNYNSSTTGTLDYLDILTMIYESKISLNIYVIAYESWTMYDGDYLNYVIT